MWILPLVGYLGVLIGFGFLTLAIGKQSLWFGMADWEILMLWLASGLYYLSELVEEHTVIAKKLLMRMIFSVIAIQFLLFAFDGFPFFLSLLSIGSHIVYLGNLRRFPVVKLSDPLFLTSCGSHSSSILTKI